MLKTNEVNIESRINRYNTFKEFQDSSKEKFEKLKCSSSRYKKFDEYYSLCICPGGRAGGLDTRIFEMFYGKRIYDSETKIKSDLNTQKEFLSEQGVTISFSMNDHGFIAIILYPAKTKYTKSIESGIFIKNYLHPDRLLSDKFLKKQWRYFNSYMECSSVDGFPTWRDKLRVRYLRNFKNLIVDKKYQPKKINTFLISTLKFVFTVGLSGFIIFLFTILPLKSDSKIRLEKNNQLEEINNNLKENIIHQRELINALQKNNDSM